MTDRALMADLVNALEAQAAALEETACTCLPELRNKFHAPSRRRNDSCCRGVKLAVKYRRLARLAHLRLAKRFVGESGYREST